MDSLVVFVVEDGKLVCELCLIDLASHPPLTAAPPCHLDV